MAEVTITQLAPVLFSAAQEVSAEPTGALQGINLNFDNQGVAKDDSVKVPVVPVQETADFTPSNGFPAGEAQTAIAEEVTISATKKTNPMSLSGEKILSLENGGNYEEWVRQWALQSMRSLRNLAEKAACDAIKEGASRAAGTKGTTPFSSTLNDLGNVRKILRANGTPFTDAQFVCGTEAEANLLNLAIIQQAQAAGSDAERRSGIIGDQFGFKIRPSGGIELHDSGNYNGLGETTSDADAGLRTVTVGSQGTGTIKKGDVFYFTDNDPQHLYVSNAETDLGSGGAITINRPGFVISTGNGKTQVGANEDYTPSFAFERQAVVGAIRPPMIKDSGIMRTMTVSDPFGMTYLWVEMDLYGKTVWEMHLAYGFKVVQPEHVAILLG